MSPEDRVIFRMELDMQDLREWLEEQADFFSTISSEKLDAYCSVLDRLDWLDRREGHDENDL